MFFRSDTIVPTQAVGRTGTEMSKKRSMQIAHFILSMSVGGGERLVRRLSQKIQLPGYSNGVICFDRIDAYEDEFAGCGVPLRLMKRKQCLFDHRLVSPLVRTIRKQQVRLIHAHDLSSLAYAVVAGNIAGAQVIMTEHSRHYIDHALKRRLEKRVLMTGASRLITVSPALMTASIEKDRIPRQKLMVIENGVDMDRFSTAPRISLHGELGIPEDQKLVLTVGRLEEIKGQQHLVRAMELLSDKVKDCHLILVGDGGSRTSLEAQVRLAGLCNRVHFLGARDDIPGLMAGSDLLVIPSESEGLPFVLLEAMASGLPVIATGVGQIPEIIGKNERGILVPPKAPQPLAKAIEKMLTMEPHILADKAHAYVTAHYSEKKMLTRYEKVYRAILNEKVS